MAEIAAEWLPEMPVTASGIDKIATREEWKQTKLARRRRGRGGGLEYHYTLLPEAAQHVLTARYIAATPENARKPRPTVQRQSGWFCPSIRMVIAGADRRLGVALP